jgi:hypothetical protein
VATSYDLICCGAYLLNSYNSAVTSIENFMRTAIGQSEEDGSETLTAQSYGFVEICGKEAEVFGFFSVTPACNKNKNCKSQTSYRNFFTGSW